MLKAYSHYLIIAGIIHISEKDTKGLLEILVTYRIWGIMILTVEWSDIYLG